MTDSGFSWKSGVHFRQGRDQHIENAEHNGQRYYALEGDGHVCHIIRFSAQVKQLTEQIKPVLLQKPGVRGRVRKIDIFLQNREHFLYRA